MTDLKIGDPAPDFTLDRDGSGQISLSSYQGHYLVLYFYPKDDTPGCTTEAIEFSQNLDKFSQLGAHILGISKDSVAKHDKFKLKHNLTVTLGSDPEGKMIEKYGVWVEKNMYGRKYMGIERATYLISPDGHILNIWRKVRVKGHVNIVLETLRDHLKSSE